MSRAERLLALNPADNHGVRGLVMNGYLREGRDTDALTLAQRYPGDAHPDLPYGRVLVFYRAGELEAAREALCSAHYGFPKVLRYLVAEQIRAPKVSPGWVRPGGSDQAWVYREEMRDLWQATPGLLDWVKVTHRRCAGSAAH
jgi:hypothetical protein